jgi:hypothetical protein
MSRRPCRTLLESLAGTSLRCRLGDWRERWAHLGYALGEHLDERSHTRAVVGALVAAGAVASEGAANLGVQLRGPSRSLVARLSVDRPDPENRQFVHDDPIAWTVAHRGNILEALYILMLGNPRLKDRDPSGAQTRFKMWWHLVGSAVEHGAKVHAEHVAALVIDPNVGCSATEISFKKLFLDGEQHEEQTSSLATVLDTLRTKWPSGFKASDLAFYLGATDTESVELKGALEQASGKSLPILTPTAVTWRLKALVDAPVLIGDHVWVLKYAASGSGNGGEFTIRRVGK